VDLRHRFDIVLVSPRNPLNIGAVARSMANFGFERLTVVAPYEPHWREARSAVGAPELLRNARESATLAEALRECSFVAGTGTLEYRKPEQPVVPLPALGPVLARELDTPGRIALVFGPEKHGLTRQDLSWCHVLVEIPTDPKQPSMNLGHAVAVSLYEVACGTARADVSEAGEPPQRAARADSATLERLAALVEDTMSAAGYSPRAMQPANRHDLRLLLRRLAPSPLDARRMLGLFRRILHRLGPDSKRQDAATGLQTTGLETTGLEKTGKDAGGRRRHSGP
jgi:tRNA/rRNA methyltransferase